MAGEFGLLGNLGTETNLVVENPAWSGDLKNTGVVEGGLIWIKIRVSPHGGEFGSTDGIGPVGGFFIDGVADGSFADAVYDFAVVGNGDVVNFFMKLSVSVEPAFDDLDTIKIGAD